MCAIVIVAEGKFTSENIRSQNPKLLVTRLRYRGFATSSSKMSHDTPFIFRQLFDRESCTYTYLLGDIASKQALLIDPVFELADRDLVVIQGLDLQVKYVVNTHMHADHITGTGILKKMLGPECKSVISKASGAAADIQLESGDVLEVGDIKLEARATPGHTNGCMSYVFHDGRRVFTGDTILIRGCGRTDFQEGNSETLYNSVHEQLFTLPDDYLVFPAHDYKGIPCSRIGEEKQLNPRLSKPLDQFKEIMNELNLPYPKQIDRSLPANKVCGLYNLPEELSEKLSELEEVNA